MADRSATSNPPPLCPTPPPPCSNPPPPCPTPPSIGILGGGQLARMLALCAHRRGTQPVVVSPSSIDPAGQVTHFHLSHSLHKWDEKLKKHISQVPVWTFESELINPGILKKMSSLKDTLVYPHPQIMAQISHRDQQKKLLLEYHLPTSPYLPIEGPTDLKAHEIAEQILKTLATASHQPQNHKWVLKTSRGGYDGRGTYFITPNTKAHDLVPFVSKFDGAPGSKGYEFIAEHTQHFTRELAFTAARSEDGDIRFLPLVETLQTEGQCDWVRGPVLYNPGNTSPEHSDGFRKETPESRRELNLAQSFRQLQEQVADFMSEISYVGVLAFELFELPEEQKLIINELAPRVHNSAHYSLDGLEYSQFDLHIQCAQGPLPSQNALIRPGFAMANILGKAQKLALPSEVSGSKVHWYGKEESRVARKMGHINRLADSPAQAWHQVIDARERIGPS